MEQIYKKLNRYILVLYEFIQNSINDLRINYSESY